MSSKGKRVSGAGPPVLQAKVSHPVVHVYIEGGGNHDDSAELSSDGVISPGEIAKKYNLSPDPSNARPASQPNLPVSYLATGGAGGMHAEMAKKMEQLIVKVDRSLLLLFIIS